jgi:hypothetical protein
MQERLALMMHAAMYALRGGVRPLVIAIVLGISGAILSSAEDAPPRSALGFPRSYSLRGKIFCGSRK